MNSHSISSIGIKFTLADKFTFDPNTNSLVELESEKDIIRFGSNESRILLLLCENPNEIISRNELHDFVWRKQGFEVDDSSLTQAVSTLRKLLKDSTKSPMFIKTVPKRGYQLICSVERASPLLPGEKEPTEAQPAQESLADDAVVTTIEEPVASKQSIQEEESIAAPTENKLVTRVMLTLALLLPLFTILFTNPNESEFRQIAVYEETPVKTPLNHPEISAWYPSIEQCIKQYRNSHAGELAPVEVIATGGQNDQLVLNYIHSLQHSGENITLRIFAAEENLNKVCQ
jgi:cholera toxin transcriptional activator